MRRLALALALTVATLAAVPAAAQDDLPIEARVKAKKTVKLIVGNWRIDPPAEALRQVTIARAALGAEVSADDLAALTDSDRARLAAATAEGQTLSDAERAAALKSIDDVLGSVRMEVTPTDVILKMGQDEQVAPWTASADADNRMTLTVTPPGKNPDPVTVHFIDADHLVLTREGADSLRLTRE